MKRFKPMLCPICEGMYFSEPNEGDLYEEDLKDYLDGKVRCRHCGWIYDLEQFENQESNDGFNDLSLNEYRKMYQEKIAENPDYDNSEEKKHLQLLTNVLCAVNMSSKMNHLFIFV